MAATRAWTSSNDLRLKSARDFWRCFHSVAMTLIRSSIRTSVGLIMASGTKCPLAFLRVPGTVSSLCGMLFLPFDVAFVFLDFVVQFGDPVVGFGFGFVF